VAASGSVDDICEAIYQGIAPQSAVSGKIFNAGRIRTITAFVVHR
jgi:hypothetical protein